MRSNANMLKEKTAEDQKNVTVQAHRHPIFRTLKIYPTPSVWGRAGRRGRD